MKGGSFSDPSAFEVKVYISLIFSLSLMTASNPIGLCPVPVYVLKSVKELESRN